MTFNLCFTNINLYVLDYVIHHIQWIQILSLTLHHVSNMTKQIKHDSLLQEVCIKSRSVLTNSVLMMHKVYQLIFWSNVISKNGIEYFVTWTWSSTCVYLSLHYFILFVVSNTSCRSESCHFCLVIETSFEIWKGINNVAIQ